ncbi:Protein msta, isoform A [Orchesella cincta]|uniref:Protein msta, isoform A n=1 Tax=Orchesella cincta TaxID=48709 RepID=A0A1D2NGW4_ORCCI|nr:Protein msta, isoform A [Orchesella cincta]
MGISKRRVRKNKRFIMGQTSSSSRNRKVDGVGKDMTEMVASASICIDIYDYKNTDSFRSSIAALASNYQRKDNYTSKVGKCAICGVSSQGYCGTCNVVFYCGKEHQREHWWKGHKNSCNPALTISKDAKKGKGARSPLGIAPFMVANKDFKVLDIVHAESSIMAGPGICEQYECEYEPLCLGCSKPVDFDQKCSKCNWPLCGPRCEENNLHARYECAVFAKNFVEELEEPFQYELVRILRCLLTREKDASKFKELMKLEAGCEKRQKDAVLTACMFVNTNCNLPEYDKELIDRMCGVVELNSLASGKHGSNMEIFAFPSKLMYSCLPNVRLVEGGDTADDDKMKIIAIRPIKKGETLTFTLLHTLKPLYLKSKFLKEQYYYECDCKMCCDPYESNTFFSAIRCMSCNQPSKDSKDAFSGIEKGYLIPKTLPVFTVWHCMNCRTEKDGQMVTELFDKTENEFWEFYEELLSMKLHEKIRRIRSKYQQYVDLFHPNHFFIWRLNRFYMPLLVDYIHSFTFPESWEHLRTFFDKIEMIIHEVMFNLLALQPGATLLKGRILYDAVRALWIFIQWAVIYGSASTFDLHPDAKYFYTLAADTIGILKFEVTEADKELIKHIKYMKNNKTNVFERLDVNKKAWRDGGKSNHECFK